MSLSTIITLLFSSLRLGSIVALAALGIVLIFRTSKATNFAQGTIGTMNAYVAAYFTMVKGYHWLVAVSLALVAAFITGIVIDKLFIRPAKKANIVGKQILTFGIIMILTGIMNFDKGIFKDLFPSVPIRPEPLFPISLRVNILGAGIEVNTIFIFTVTLVLLAFVFWFIQKTKWGLATRVTASSEETAMLMGVPTKTVTMFSWAFAAMLGALAGIFLSSRVAMDPLLLVSVQVGAFFAGVFGGFTTFHGPVIAAYLIGFVINISSYFTSSVLRKDALYAEVAVYLLILVILYFKPYGLFGKKPTRKV
ncbi:branched-chain amino acid ABC transporter permease [Hujiaoplasma nucleasis]|uniref:Branched-chain amino acid ABC transporter permease n=1 Tax=Hujiaoplasma nucleasis TaxID=2725268 RepID=A0A7L6N516_9MOLU|nr:branched-chain amino acid ABC transporter permease [Hujiaoplasma nucleasis]QLY40095.1 branched-chain amino acid ABC transporter permease [Hujiaoplasma nucleasis]